MTMAPGTAATGRALTTAAVLTSTYQRLTACCEALDARVAAPGPAARGQLDGAELAESPAALDAFVGAEAARIRAHHGRAPRGDVAASRALHGYLWTVSLLMSGAWYLERRVPRVHPREVRLDPSTGAFEVLPASGFACLPDDPAAGLPGTRVLGHEEALRAELRAAVADHVRPLLAAAGPYVRRGPRALWGMVTDDLVSGIWYLGRALGEEERAIAAATELLPAGLPPFPGGAAFRVLHGAEGRRYPTRTRLGCCLYYTLEPAQACLTCPRTCDAERVRRLDADG
ncbi:(2Fe-2S)-binding protein [Streptomyces sp. WAC05374]|uniref:(2Fe-2S)-binding protein n=1 Tax=Streptomyces sp. WAC05374 TaxID=2487420 RepID=UPI000F886908|nr:(2Fe-2S)-binding protein [Streptomyces sp. WAC05374]RST04743.1 (2Fe-2S)-binding protein [Streptomyces sp. WAC05374]TDF50555.1 (2Fe-2S)-binding protein [Streptomyces sp. WAC05374]TDF56844.1 (2Fe-2S)-binding protein [Streptomyces sp. WAC05374]TDF60807.1 (2Fe-2S)-binding protein [Streptomyces sp. WAC05374]